VGTAGKKSGAAAKSAVAADQASGAAPAAQSSRAGTPAAAVPSNPAPYRVTLRLPGADPAAPAEVVTRALRAAGVAFEVETIERMPSPPAAIPAARRQPAPALPATTR
jgi:hypothetical protein